MDNCINYIYDLPEILLIVVSMLVFFFILIRGYMPRDIFFLWLKGTIYIFLIGILSFMFFRDYLTFLPIFSYSLNLELNGFNSIFKIVLLLSILPVLVIIRNYKEISDVYFPEIFVYLLLSLFAAMFTISALNFLEFYLAIELQTLSIILLISSSYGSKKFTETSIKYLVLSILMTNFYLMGVALVYKSFGTIYFYDIGCIMLFPIFRYDALLLYVVEFLGFFFVLISVFFKLSLVPFHYWVVDMYSGSSRFVIVYASTISKIIFIVTLVRFNEVFGFFNVFYWNSNIWSILFIWLGLLSIIIGSLAALYQRRIMAFVGFSSITTMGYIMIIFSLFSDYTTPVICLYLISYIINLVGIFLVVSVRTFSNISSITYNYQIVETINNENLSSGLTTFMLVCFLAALPVAITFLLKVYIFFLLLKANLYLYSLLIAILSVVNTYYYLYFFRSLSLKSTKILVTDDIKLFDISNKISLSLVLILIAGVTSIVGGYEVSLMFIHLI